MNGHERVIGALAYIAAALVLLLSASIVSAAETNPFGAMPSPGPAVRHTPRVAGIHLDLHADWSVGLEGYAGLTTLSSVERTSGHAIVGGLSRLRWYYFEIGAGVEASDYANERWRSLSGFIGAYLPFTNWVDLDASVGFATRHYVSSDTRYGPNGASVQTQALTLRLGLSDRPIERLLSPRLGAALLIGIDLKRQDVPWSFEVPGMEPIVGVTKFGGITAGLVMNFGLDLALRGDS